MVEQLDNGKILVNGIELQYIAGSLIPFFKLKHKNKDIQKENFDDYVNMLNYMKMHLKGYFTLGTLYNAFQEKNDGILLESNPLGNEIILSDSGGLQQARRGEKFSEETKKDIYINQAQYSDIAMNFDEMPFKTIEANSETGVNLMASRCYIREMIKESATMSADEVRKQIEVFDSIEARAKITPIIHGFRPHGNYYKDQKDNTYIEYAKEMIKHIDNSKHHVGGLSFGSNTVSADNRVSVLKLLKFIPSTIWSKEIPDEYLEHIHLLGVASPQRLMIILSMVRANLIDPRVKRISFDSTALTKAYTVGKIHKNRYEFENKTPMRPELTLKDYHDPSAKNVRHYYQQVFKYFEKYETLMFDSWEDLAEHSYNNGDKRKMQEQIEAKGGVGSEWHKKSLQGIRICTLYATWCYLEAMEDYVDGRRTTYDFPYGTDLNAIYQSVEHDITDANTLHDVVDMHFSKVKSNMDFGVNTFEEFEYESSRLMTEHKKGVQETNVLFDDVDKLHKAHEDQKAFANIKRDNNNFIRRSKKVHKDEHIIAKDITDSLF
jgi:hypothetical protein